MLLQLLPSNIDAHHKGTAHMAAISGCCCCVPMNLIVIGINHTTMIDAVLQSSMPVTIIITAIQQHSF